MGVVRSKPGANPGEIKNRGDAPDLVIVRNHGLPFERIEQLALLAVAPPHHRTDPSRPASHGRNHATPDLKSQFCNKIGQ